MKNNFTNYTKLFSALFFLLLSSTVYAQPANDDCSTAITLDIAADEASCVALAADTRNANDATANNVLTVCSGSWYTDDVFFKITVPDVIPANGVTLKVAFDNNANATDVIGVGMALYATDQCDAANTNIACFSNDDETFNLIEIQKGALKPGATHLLRVWSGGSPTDNAGTFTICAYATPAPAADPNVFWSEDFEDGIGDWTETTLTDPTEKWVYDTLGIVPYFSGTFRSLSLNAVPAPGPVVSSSMTFPAAWYETGMTGNTSDIPNPFVAYTAELISPVIDLSDVTENIALEFRELVLRLNPNPLSGPFSTVSISTDGGMTWGPNQPVNTDVEANSGSSAFPVQNRIERLQLPGLAGESNVRIKFRWTCDFYYWIIDDVKIVRATDYDAVALSNRYAAAPNPLTPASQLVPHHFLLDIRNNGQEELTGINLNITIEDLINPQTVFSSDEQIASLAPLSELSNTIWAETWTPDSAVGAYAGTYTITHDSLDQFPNSDAQTYAFAVSDSTFAKDLSDIFTAFTLSSQVGGFFIPTDLNTTVGNCYYVPNGDGMEVTSTYFQLSNAADMAGGFIDFILYKWEDINEDNIPQGNELGNTNALGGEILGFTQYEITGMEEGDIRLQLEPEEGDNLLLEDDSYYILAVSARAPGEDPIGIAATANYEYLNSFFVSDSVADNTQFHSFYADEAGFNIDFDRGLFGESPRIVMNINEFIPTNTDNPVLTEDNLIDVYPNPTNKELNLEVELVEITKNAQIRIFDRDGKLMAYQEHNDVQNQVFNFSVEEYSSGLYFIQIITDNGYKTKRFTVAK